MIPLALLGLAAGAVTAPSVTAAPSPSANAIVKSDKDLGEADRARVAQAVAEGKSTVTLLVAAQRDRLAAATDALRALGGVVQKTDDAVDYVKV